MVKISDIFPGKGHSLFIAVLFLITMCLYFNSVGNGFVWDDHEIVVNDPTIRSLTNVVTLFSTPAHIFQDDSLPYYRPVNRLLYLIIYSLVGLNPVYFHLANILIHSLNAILLYFIVFRILDNKVPALFCALLFAVHPINSESVNFVSGSTDLLALFFTLASFIVYQQGRERNKIQLYLLAGLLFLFGCLCKETTFILPLFILLYEVTGTTMSKDYIKRLIPPFLSYLFFSGLYLFLRGIVLSGLMGGFKVTEGLIQRLAQNFYIVPKYLSLLLFPIKLNAYYTLPGEYPFKDVLLLVAWLVISAAVYLLLKFRTRASLFGMLWLGINFLLISNVIPFPSAAMAERYMYLPAIGAWLIAGERGYLLWTARGKMVLMTSVLILSLFAARTFIRNFDWKNDHALFTSIVSANPNSAYGYYNLGNAYKEQGDLARAKVAWEKTITLDPSHSSALCQIGNVYLMERSLNMAEHYYRQALQSNRNNQEAHYNLALIMEDLGRIGEAIFHYDQFMNKVPPEYADIVPVLELKIKDLKNRTKPE